MSHLLAQGHVSAEAVVDEVLRDQVRAAITKAAGKSKDAAWLDVVPPSTDDIERDMLKAAYAVIANSKANGIERLPFFSRLTLMQTLRDLSRIGFNKVALVRIPVEAASTFPDEATRPATAATGLDDESQAQR